MQDLNLDLTSIAAIWMGGSVLMVALAGLTARFGLVPLLDSVARLRAAGRAQAAAPDARLEALERRLAELARAVDRAAEEAHRGRAAA